MKKIFLSKKVITLVSFLSVVLVFYIFISTDGNLFASTNTIPVQDKGMSVEEFQKKISGKEKLVLVYYHASWCVPCIKLKPEMIELEKATKDYCEILQIDVDDNPKITDYYEINSLPMFVLYKNGKKMWENIGTLSKIQLQSKTESFK